MLLNEPLMEEIHATLDAEVASKVHISNFGFKDPSFVVLYVDVNTP